jgi:hypothetical protein
MKACLENIEANQKKINQDRRSKEDDGSTTPVSSVLTQHVGKLSPHSEHRGTNTKQVIFCDHWNRSVRDDSQDRTSPRDCPRETYPSRTSADGIRGDPLHPEGRVSEVDFRTASTDDLSKRINWTSGRVCSLSEITVGCKQSWVTLLAAVTWQRLIQPE